MLGLVCQNTSCKYGKCSGLSTETLQVNMVIFGPVWWNTSGKYGKRLGVFDGILRVLTVNIRQTWKGYINVNDKKIKTLEWIQPERHLIL